jgi:hypothetical protein
MSKLLSFKFVNKGAWVNMNIIFDNNILIEWCIKTIDVEEFRNNILMLLNLKQMKKYLCMNKNFDISEYIENIITKYLEINSIEYKYKKYDRHIKLNNNININNNITSLKL